MVPTSGGAVSVATSTGPSVTVDHAVVSTLVSSGNVSLGSRAAVGNPAFVNPNGADGIPSTDDDDFAPGPGSAAWDAGANSAAPLDALDEDNDQATNDPSPKDFEGKARFTDMPVADTGVGAAPIVDIGAIEADPTPPSVVTIQPSASPIFNPPAFFFVVFDRPVTGPAPSDALLGSTGGIDTTGVEVSGFENLWSYQVDFVGDSGLISFDLQDSDKIVSRFGVPLNGVGASLIPGASVSVEVQQLTIVDFFNEFPHKLPGQTVQFGIGFSETASGVSGGAFRLVESGVTGSAITNVFSQDGQNYTIEITLGALLPGATFGSVRLDLIDDDTISSQLTGALLNGPGSSTINGPSVTVSGDCNANGEPDASDLNSGASQDCNSNGVPDECDISGSLPDQSFGPLPYLRQSDSPFPLSGLGTTAFIETAEDGLLNTPGVTTNGATVCGCGGINDSVDADDGTVDGSGTSGSSIFAGDGAGGILFTFNTGAFGRLPQYAGVVFTDGGLGGNVTFEARDGAGNPIGSFPAYTADGSNGGTTAEDRFFGIVHAAGIGSIRIRCTGGGIEADHLQYGVFAGSSQDNNSNGIPDECEGPAGTVYSVNQSWRVTGSTPPAGWNTQTAFDDSDAAGWIAPFPQGSDAQVGQYVWSAPGDTGGSSTTWMRKKVNLLSVPTIATLKASADDDVTVFVNGQQVASDANCLSGPLLSTDVTALLVPGENLIAAVATDCGCCGRGVGVRLEFSGGAADCNENGIDDLTEIASSAVPDTNGNGVPDPCELVQGTPGDCNNNGINDASDINLGVSTDCNFNNIPDECEALKSPVYFSGFEGGVGPEWSVGNSATTPSGRAFLGELANSTAVLSLSNLPAHTALAVDFDLFIIRSWDGNSSPGEILGVRLDGVTHRAWTFSNVVGGSQSYPRTFGTASVPARDGAAEFESLGYGAAPFGDSVYRVRLLLPHSAPDAQIAWFAEHLEGISNESWGLDNVKVSVIAPGTGDCNADGRPDACGEPLADGTAITPYVTFAQGPFAGIAAKWLYLDTFESGSISAPGVSVAGAAVFGPNSFIDSVDEDNGSIDGNGNSGARSLYSSSGDATIYFNSLDLGGAPQFAGIAFTDLSFGPRDVTFDVYDTGGTLVETRTDNLGAIATNGDTSEDRLLWAVHRGGIGWIRVFAAGTDLELDHLQFGRFAFQDCNANGFEDACDIASGEPDQNGDGVPDTCLSGAGPRPFPFHGPSRVSLGVTPFGSGTANMLVADLNRDEQNDAVVIANSSANASVFVRASQTELMFARYDIGLSAPARNVVASDFDRDGSIDLVFSTRSGAAQRLNVVYSSLSRGGPFDNDGLIGGSGATILAMTLIDVDRDGYEDIAGVDASGNLVVFINTSFPGSISFGDESVALPGLGSPDFAAIARTSILSGGNDLVVAMGENAGGGRLIRLENSGDAFDVLGVDSTHAYTCVASANIDADGVAEILAGHTGGLKVFDSAGNFEQDLEGFNAVEVKLGDIDRNGFVDALVLNEDGTCTQLVNDHGFFAPRSTGTLTGDPLIAIGLGDVEPDGDLDLWATADGDESLFVVPSLLPHRQQGFFSTSGVAASGDAPSSMAVGDFNGDGTPDIAAASFFDDTVKWARFDHGQFRFVQTTIVGPGNDPVADGPSAVAVADFNLDGRDDVAVAGILNSRLVVRFNPGNSGAWAGATVDSVATGIGSLAVADFNADGAPDIAAGLATPGTVRLYLNRANGIAGVFEPVTLPAVFPGVRSIAVGDLNSDGRPDIVAACPAGNLLRLALQTDPILRSERNVLIPEFNVSSSIALNGANVVTAGDFNGDGRDDIASSSPLISVAIVYPQTVFGEFAGGTALQAPQSVSSMFRADVNADGNADLMMVGRQADSVWVARGVGAGSFQVSSSFAQLESATAVVAADFDRDGNTDLASASFATDKVFWTRNFAASLGAYGVGQLSS
ncbi:MAG: VCBS repeat-containing protein, partial [Planctomycetes bacterium]|nr:VCBS repeat-containing protein [Planctomycetota bacterium]